jgi:hypothetical protein
MSQPSSPDHESQGSVALFWWHSFRPWVIAVVCVSALSALFYAEENWRGRQAWEKCRRKLEEKGDILDWSAYIPAPVPDDQNVFKAPKIQEWFVKNTSGRSAPFGRPGSPFTPTARKQTNDYLLAEVTVRPVSGQPDSQETNAVLRFGESQSPIKARKAIDDVIGATMSASVGYTLVARPVKELRPVHLELQAGSALNLKDIAAVFPSNSIPPLPQVADWKSSNLKVAAADTNVFRIWLGSPAYGAADYLEWTSPLTNDLNVLRAALERPYVRIDGDYQQPFQIPIPNFVRMRMAAQLLSQRAQCYLLSGQPEEAWHELKLLRDMCRLLHTEPGGKPMTLVAAMIETAITGLYTGIVNDGLRLHAWREPELVAIQKQLAEVNLVSGLEESLRFEGAAISHTLETMGPRKLRDLMSLSSRPPTLWERIKQPFELAPRGWVYQNMAFIVSFNHEMRGTVSSRENLVLPHAADLQLKQLNKTLNHVSPYNFLGALTIPNIAKATQTLARNQTLANEAQIACGLERYRLAQGHYPETLKELVPQFLEHVPRDIIGGQELKYHRTGEQKYLLYSVGWNERDDGGVPAMTITEGDWVWEQN